MPKATMATPGSGASRRGADKRRGERTPSPKNRDAGLGARGSDDESYLDDGDDGDATSSGEEAEDVGGRSAGRAGQSRAAKESRLGKTCQNADSDQVRPAPTQRFAIYFAVGGAILLVVIARFLFSANEDRRFASDFALDASTLKVPKLIAPLGHFTRAVHSVQDNKAASLQIETTPALFSLVVQDLEESLSKSMKTRTMAATKGSKLVRSVNGALLQRSENEPTAFLITYDSSSTGELMGLKNHLDLSYIPIADDASTSLNGVGFVFIGRNLDPRSCASTQLSEINDRHDWGLNFRGRLRDAVKICE